MNARFLAIPALALAFLGAGCTPTPAPTTQTPAQTPVQWPLTDNGEANTWQPELLTPATTDETWKTYTNTALGFSFATPTKGRYAPEWEVKIFRDDAKEVSDGYAAEGARIDTARLGKTSDGREFYISQGTEGAAGSIYFNDAYSTHIGKSVIVIIFQKKAIMADIGDCKRADGQKYWSQFATPQSCIPFSEEEYFKTLDGIVGTFTTR